jgi:hypothetical protein
MAVTRSHKLPNCYFVGPDGLVTTAPVVDAELLRSPLVRQLLGMGPRGGAVREENGHTTLVDSR